mgnify:CR=1 FL=1
MNCSNCGCGLVSMKCDYCGTLNKPKGQLSTELENITKMQTKLQNQLDATRRMKMPETLKKKKIQLLEEKLDNLK